MANGVREILPLRFNPRSALAHSLGASELGNSMKHLNRFIRDRSGATAIEYVLLLSGMALAVIGILSFFGVQLNDLFLLLAAANT